MQISDPELLQELEEIKKTLLNAIRKNDKEEQINAYKKLDDLEKKNNIKINNVFDKFFLPISKLSKNEIALINKSGENNTTEYLETRKNKTISIKIDFDIDYLDNEKITLPSNYTKYLDTVQMAIGSIMDCGEKYISAEQVIRKINGLTSKDKVQPDAIKEMEKIFKQLRGMFIRIDRSEELKGITGSEHNILGSTILDYGKYIEIKNQKGNKIKVYEIRELPILYQYSKSIKQIRAIPIELMKIKGLRSSKQNTVIKIWLLQQIESMKTTKKNGKHRNNIINIKTLFESLKYDIQFYEKNERATKSKYIKQTFQILDYWKEKKYIKDYKQNLKNRSLQSIEILL